MATPASTLSSSPAPAIRGKAKNIPKNDALLLPYQARWVKDTSRLKIAEKSRQIGWTWATAYSLVRRKGLKSARLDAWISSRDEIQARLFLEDCKTFGSLLDVAARDMGDQVIDDKGHSAYVLAFANKLRIHSMSSNPDAQAGKRGDRVLDEFALHPDPRKLYSIAYPGITWGGQFEIFSTHRGSANYFNKLITEIKEKNNPKRFSLHRVTLEDALNDGFLYKLQSKLPEDDERQDMTEADYYTFIRQGCADEESFLQEYCCQPADDATAFLPSDLIATCFLRGDDVMKVNTEETTDQRGRKGSIRTLTTYAFSELATLPGSLYLGMDVARKKDLTVLWVAVKLAGVLFPVAIVEMSNVAFSRQRQVLYSYLELPNMRRACMDATGLGMQLSEEAQEKFGENRVEPVTFTGPIKEALAFPLRSAFEDRIIRCPDDDKVEADLRAIKKQTTEAGNVRFAADHGPDGHADRFWAAALCVHAERQQATGRVEVRTAGTREQGESLRNYADAPPLSRY